MKMYVIMGNDYPAGICSTHEKADKAVELKQLSENKRERESGGHVTKIYWRAYDFEVDALIKD